ncbi:MAG: tRNA (adenosine(37)-N6)-threonylcarbamoyltransferase complex ATPase subunit type 1 TsaE [Chloroflexi bacterium]|nr:tRNA (adenosine(37)-N6)-threonylcarbamoyltransferase complex ATPase subunit type 1 TsaE [Chloroflexota bacterium]
MAPVEAAQAGSSHDRGGPVVRTDKGAVRGVRAGLQAVEAVGDQRLQGLADGLDVRVPVSSPSFVIETRYRGRLTLYHIDLYRLDSIEDALVESLEEDLYADGVSAVEWAEHLPARLREDSTLIRFEIDHDNESARSLTLITTQAHLRDAVK